VPPGPETCTPIPDFLINGNYTAIIDTLSIGPAAVNPDNPDEIVFFHNGSRTLYHFNRQDSALTLIDDFVYLFQAMKWNPDGRILANYGDLTQIFTPLGGDFGDLLITNTNTMAWGPEPDMAVANTRPTFALPVPFTFTGSITDPSLRDTLPISLEHDRAWVSADTIFTGGAVYVISSDQLHTVVETNGPTYVSALDRNRFYAADLNRLYLIDAVNLTYNVVVEYPNCEGYSHIQYHAGMDKIFAVRTHRTTFEATTAIIERSDLVWLNRDGTVHEVIDLLPLIFPE
jgi:hypothetical protein